MNSTYRRWSGLILVIAVGILVITFKATSSSAQDPAADLAVALGRCISTKVVTLKLENQRGEPRMTTGTAKFDRPVQAYWVALVGSDLKFEGNTEKYINRQMVSVDPFAKLIDGNTLEVSGKFGIRDGSGDWDDTYEGTVTVAVTALMSSK